MREIWKEIDGFNNYEISTLGKVKNVKTGRILKAANNGTGYLQVRLCVNGKVVHKYVHRLVAEYFIPNLDNKTDVNHIDEDKLNNRADNLNWMTRTENVNWGTGIYRQAVSISKQIYALYPDGTDKYFPSITIASRELGLSQGNISSVLVGRRKTTGGYRFEYAGND